MMVIEPIYEIGQTVYLVTEKEQLPRLVIAIIVNKYDLLYELINTTTTSRHYDYEITDTKNVLADV